jgi:catecholate siderophore receptor
VKDVLRNTAGITFLAAEGGEEDIRLRGFSLAGTGDIFMDGMRDPAFYDRDTFNNDRIEVLRGSASMLFGRGSTGGAVNQVSKMPRLINEHEVTTTLGTHKYGRITGDFNLITGENAALRLNAMATKADNNGSGSSIDKKGIAAAYRFGIGTANEFSASLYHLDNNNGMNYGLPWIKPTRDRHHGRQHADRQPVARCVLRPGQRLQRRHRPPYLPAWPTRTASADDSELKTQLRTGAFKRDQRAGTVRFAANALQPGGQAVDLSNFGPNTVFTRGTQLKVQDVDTLQWQSDFTNKFEALGYKHELVAGVDFSREEKVVYGVVGANPAKPNTLAGTPDDGASMNEGARVLRPANNFESRAVGAYVQDLVQVAPAWKLLGGLRYDSMRGNYATTTPATGAVTATYQQKISELSKRFGVLYQPNALHSYHFSYGTSFNTSGDTYSYNALSANTDPEQSQNIEFGAKLDSADKRFSTRLAIFHATKKNERNTDPDTAATRLLLSGKRHTAGFEIDVSGRMNPKWEVYGSYMWMPVAKVDVAASTATTVGNRAGDRPGLSPRHSGTVWTTYQITPQWRVGGGLNFRSAQSAPDVTAPSWEAPAFTTADLMAEYAINDRFIVKANLTNITDKLYGESLYRGHYIPGAGRMLQVALTAKF